MSNDFKDPKYSLLVAILDECARANRVRRHFPSGYGLDVSDIDIVWLYEKLTALGANLESAEASQGTPHETA